MGCSRPGAQALPLWLMAPARVRLLCQLIRQGAVRLGVGRLGRLKYSQAVPETLARGLELSCQAPLRTQNAEPGGQIGNQSVLVAPKHVGHQCGIFRGMQLSCNGVVRGWLNGVDGLCWQGKRKRAGKTCEQQLHGFHGDRARAIQLSPAAQRLQGHGQVTKPGRSFPLCPADFSIRKFKQLFNGGWLAWL